MSKPDVGPRGGPSRPGVNLAALLCVAGSMGGCVLSVAPIVDEEHAVEVPGLAGAWVADDDTATIASVGDGDYRVTLVEDDGRSRFSARTGKLGDRLVLDAWAELEGNGPAGLTESVVGTLIPGHVLIVLELEGDRLRTAVLEADSVVAAIRTGALRTPSHEDEAMLLTGSTDSLRAALAGYLERPGALAEWREWTRVAGGATEAPPPE